MEICHSVSGCHKRTPPGKGQLLPREVSSTAGNEQSGFRTWLREITALQVRTSIQFLLWLQPAGKGKQGTLQLGWKAVAHSQVYHHVLEPTVPESWLRTTDHYQVSSSLL